MPRMRGWFDDDANPFIPAYVTDPSHDYLSASNAAISSGRSLERRGLQLQKTAPVSMPAIASKIWSPYRKHELIEMRTKGGLHRDYFYTQPVSKFDHRPPKMASHRRIQRHYSRSYGPTIYSQPPEKNIRFHRAKRYHTGTAMRGGGILLKTLGWFGLAYTAYYIAKNPNSRDADLALAMLIGGIKYTRPFGALNAPHEQRQTEHLADELGKNRTVMQRSSPYAKLAVSAALSAHPVIRHL